ncbi:site-specific DNA-methyltransferase [Sporosarcina sp. ACRSL]|uniref:DNA-methyltransferase n=1 Tax=Sporosarcina sp. ACRSL TaxID=2918215 RepID=UPI001EF6DF1D|nr:site-specific DNA-methyltransferase [Sporosarcina sp. ACRSL]MCG7345319.1 site-specific DNA-methyltransferase [Sporosarcina sp. ACRSL]
MTQTNATHLNKITQGDSLEVLRELADNSIDLTVTSPPYDNLRTYNGFTWDFEGIAQELYRVTKDGGVVVWIVNDATINGSETGTSFRQVLHFMECGFKLHDTMIWQKISPFQHKNRYIASFEYMFILSKGKPKTANLIKDRKNKWGGTAVHGTLRQIDGSLKKPTGMKVGRKVAEYGARLNIWEMPGDKANKTGHPAVFPEPLAQDHILTWSNEGDVVLDCFGGSGTTAKLALLNNRNFIHIDISEEYVAIANQRIVDAIQTK